MTEAPEVWSPSQSRARGWRWLQITLNSGSRKDELDIKIIQKVPYKIQNSPANTQT